MLRIFNGEKLPENPYSKIKSLLSNKRDREEWDDVESTFLKGQQSVVDISKPAEWLDSDLIFFLLDCCPPEWFGDWNHRATLIEKIQHSDKSFSQFIQEKLGLKEVDQMLHLNADDGYPDQH